VWGVGALLLLLYLSAEGACDTPGGRQLTACPSLPPPTTPTPRHTHLPALTADFAVHLREPVDRVEVEWVVVPDAPNFHSSRGIYITGLLLYNASWDVKQSSLCQPKPAEHAFKFPVVGGGVCELAGVR
jgi:hypothetical protein